MQQFKHMRILQLSSFKYQYTKDCLCALYKLGTCLLQEVICIFHAWFSCLLTSAWNNSLTHSWSKAASSLFSRKGWMRLLSPLELKGPVWATYKHKASILSDNVDVKMSYSAGTSTYHAFIWQHFDEKGNSHWSV